jgi:site-specific recombinase XerD
MRKKKQMTNLQKKKVRAFSSKCKKITLEDYIILFNEYLKNQRGLSTVYRLHVCNIGRLFLRARFGSRAIHPSQIKINDITDFINGYARHDSPRRTQAMTSALRSFLRFLKFKNMTALDFSTVVPRVAVWKQDRIPDFLTELEVKKLLNHCDKKTPMGLRDYTILRLLSGLGLRAGEVANLKIEDFDYTNGELIIHGKGPRISRLPLTQDLGDDLVAYLLKRPSSSSRSFFVSTNRPFQGLKVSSISLTVGKLLQRLGLKKKGKAQLLRHSLATSLLNKGASLQEVGEVLRHQSIDSTAIYAKVDFNRLRPLALPWPGHLDFGGAV